MHDDAATFLDVIDVDPARRAELAVVPASADGRRILRGVDAR